MEYDVQPMQLALGKNLVGIRVTDRADLAKQNILIEKLELDVRYIAAKQA